MNQKIETGIVQAKLQRGISRMGWTPYWLVDEQGNLLNTEPVCSVPDGWHDWFIKYLETVRTPYYGIPDSTSV